MTRLCVFREPALLSTGKVPNLVALCTLLGG